jgi:hypothetical protein
MLVSEVRGDLPKIIGNEEQLYEGELTFYFRTLFFRSRNLHNPYHNFRHMLHVLWLCHKLPKPANSASNAQLAYYRIIP